jgi:hypothetical protein
MSLLLCASIEQKKCPQAEENVRRKRQQVEVYIGHGKTLETQKHHKYRNRKESGEYWNLAFL